MIEKERKIDIEREREIEMRNIVEVKEVFKTIDKEEILSGINLQIAEGEIYGFLGPNGAGKTTTIGKLAKNSSSVGFAPGQPPST